MLSDRTNETIPLSLEPPVEGRDLSGIPGWDGYSVPTGSDISDAPVKYDPASVTIDSDFESDRIPQGIVWFQFFTDEEPWFKLTYEEAELVYRRLGLVLGKGNSHLW